MLVIVVEAYVVVLPLHSGSVRNQESYILWNCYIYSLQGTLGSETMVDILVPASLCVGWEACCKMIIFTVKYIPALGEKK